MGVQIFLFEELFEHLLFISLFQKRVTKSLPIVCQQFVVKIISAFKIYFHANECAKLVIDMTVINGAETGISVPTLYQTPSFRHSSVYIFFFFDCL